MNTEDGERQSTSSIRDPVPQYEGEDVRPTSKQELAGWYSYGWAAEVFTVCAMGSFLPITLEQMARNQGYLLSDPSTPCTSTWKTGNEGFSAASGSELTANSSSATGEQCFIWLFNTKINTASFAMYTFSISVAVQSLLIISMSGAADHGVFRKKFLLAFAMMGSVSLMLFIAIRYYLVAGLIAIISNTCFGASFVLLNSFLPLLVRHHPLTREAKEQRSNSITVGAQQASEHSPLLQDQRDGDTARDAKPQATSTELMLSTEISSWGIGIGYVGSLLLLIISIGIVVATGSTTFSLRLVLFAVGMWWLLFTIPAWLWLRPRPGPPLPGLTASQSTSERWVWVRYLTFAWKSLGRTALSIRHLKDVLLFLLAWFCLSDGIATVSGTAVLFAKTQLNMNVAALGMINVTAMLAGVFGAFMWNWISRICNWNATQTIVACICLFEVIPIYGLLGFVPQ
ncbi:Autophagy protein 22, partial [Ascosphaera atra]